MNAEPTEACLTDESPAARLLDETDPREACSACAGTGRVSETSTIFAAVALGGLAGLLDCAYRGLTGGGFSWGLCFASICVAIFGLLMRVDRDECEACGGMGRMEQEDEGDEENAPWANAEPPA